jgi:hypothetical protein
MDAWQRRNEGVQFAVLPRRGRFFLAFPPGCDTYAFPERFLSEHPRMNSQTPMSRVLLSPARQFPCGLVMSRVLVILVKL